MRRFVIVLTLCFAGAMGTLGAQLATPSDWKWRQDSPAPLAAKMEPGSWFFVQMPPGWHVTTGPGALLYPESHGEAAGNYSLDAEMFLFPGDSQSEYGVFLGGREVDGAADYTAFVLRRDGQAAIIRRRAGRTGPLADWQRHESVTPHKGGSDAVKNVIRVDVDPVAATMHVNGAKILSVPRQDLEADGRVGLRIGKDMNLHISTFTLTRRFAPTPARKSQ